MFFLALGVILYYPTFISAFIHLSQSVLFVVGNQLLFNLGTIFINLTIFLAYNWYFVMLGVFLPRCFEVIVWRLAKP
jgi:hypothetical protein